MALYNRDLKFIYLFEPHTASRATLEVLTKEVRGTAQISHHHIGIEEMTNWRRQRLRQTDVLECRVISTVRNPLDTLITRWRQSPYKDVPFERFYENHKNHPLVINPGMGLYLEATLFCWYEDLQEDLRWMFNRPDLNLGWNEKHKTKQKQPWNTYYSPQMVEELQHTYKDYLNRFGYSYEYVDDELVCNIDKSVRANLCQKLL